MQFVRFVDKTESLHMDSIGEFNRGMKQAEEDIFFLLHLILRKKKEPKSGSRASVLLILRKCVQIQGYVDNERRK